MIFEAKDGAFYADGKKTAVYSGAMHYFRILPDYRLLARQTAKAQGVRIQHC